MAKDTKEEVVETPAEVVEPAVEVEETVEAEAPVVEEVSEEVEAVTEEVSVKSKSKPLKKPLQAEEVEEVAPVDEHEGETRIESADGRTLEVSINDVIKVGKVIWVPNDQAEEYKRLLTEGKFYIK